MVNTKLEKLNLLDKFLFDEAMEDSETYQTVISILLENEVGILVKTGRTSHRNSLILWNISERLRTTRRKILTAKRLNGSTKG